MFYEKRKGSYVGGIILNQFYCEYKGILFQRHDASQQEKSFVERMFKIEMTVELFLFYLLGLRSICIFFSYCIHKVTFHRVIFAIILHLFGFKEIFHILCTLTSLSMVVVDFGMNC